MNSASRRPRAAPARSTSTPLRRPASAPSPSTRRAPSVSSASPAVRRTPRPAWNGYLTDESQYKLSRERQLVRQMQHLSAAHFHSRHGQGHVGGHHNSGDDGDDDDDVRDSGSASSHSSEVSASQHSSHPRSARGTRVDDHTTHARSHDRMRGELSALEHMLSELEIESERVNAYESQLAEVEGHSDDRQHTGRRSRGFDGDQSPNQSLSVVYEVASDSTYDHGEHDDGETSEDAGFYDDPVAQICYKSLRVGVDLTQKMQLLVQKLEVERRHRRAHEKRIHDLEELYRTMQRRNEVVETRYEELASQVDAMRDAMIATEEALHRVSMELAHAKASREEPPSTVQRTDHRLSAAYEHLHDHDVEAEIREDGALHARPAWRPAQNGLRINSDLMLT